MKLVLTGDARFSILIMLDLCSAPTLAAHHALARLHDLLVGPWVWRVVRRRELDPAEADSELEVELEPEDVATLEAAAKAATPKLTHRAAREVLDVIARAKA